jgi:hypothetical protein
LCRQLADALDKARVVVRSSGLALVVGERSDLVKAAGWAVLTRAKPRAMPAIY